MVLADPDHNRAWPLLLVAAPEPEPTCWLPSAPRARELTRVVGVKSTAEFAVPDHSSAWSPPMPIPQPHPTCCVPVVALAVDSVKPDRVVGCKSTTLLAVP